MQYEVNKYYIFYSLSPGFSYDLVLQKTVYEREKHPYVSNCRDTWHESLKPFLYPYVKYNSNICKTICLIANLVDKCNCTVNEEMGMRPQKQCNRTAGNNFQAKEKDSHTKTCFFTLGSSDVLCTSKYLFDPKHVPKCGICNAECHHVRKIRMTFVR